MNEYQVTCITKPDRANRHGRITHIGNTLAKWCMTVESAIQRIEAKTEAYYTVDPSTGKRSYIGVVREAGSLPYLRTYADSNWNDNLLALPECSGCSVVS